MKYTLQAGVQTSRIGHMKHIRAFLDTLWQSTWFVWFLVCALLVGLYYGAYWLIYWTVVWL